MKFARTPYATVFFALALVSCAPEKSSPKTNLEDQPVAIKSVTIGNLKTGDLGATTLIADDAQTRFVRLTFESNFLKGGEWHVFNCAKKSACESDPTLSITAENSVYLRTPNGTPELRTQREGSKENDLQSTVLILPRTAYASLGLLIRVELRAAGKSDQVYLEKFGSGHVLLTDSSEPSLTHSTPPMESYPWNLPSRPFVGELQKRGVAVTFVRDAQYISSHATWSMEEMEKKLDARLQLILKAPILPNKIILSDNTWPLAVKWIDGEETWSLGWRSPLTELNAHVERAKSFATWKKSQGIELNLGALPAEDLFPEQTLNEHQREQFKKNLALHLQAIQQTKKLKLLRVRLQSDVSATETPDLASPNDQEIVFGMGVTLMEKLRTESFSQVSDSFLRALVAAEGFHMMIADAGFSFVRFQLNPITYGSLVTSEAHYLKATQDVRELIPHLKDLRARRPDLKTLFLSYDHQDLSVTAKKWLKIEGNQIALQLPRHGLEALDSQKQINQVIELIKSVSLGNSLSR